MNLSSSAIALQRNHSANILPTQTLMRKIRVSHLAAAASGIASSAPAANTTPPGLAKSIFSSTCMRHQCTAMILIQRRVRDNASFQGVGERRRLTTLASPRKSRRKSMAITRETKVSDVQGKAEPSKNLMHLKATAVSGLNDISSICVSELQKSSLRSLSTTLPLE